MPSFKPERAVKNQHLKHHMKTREILLSTMGTFLVAVAAAQAQTTFTQVTTGNIVNDSGLFVFAGWGDFKNDGFLDLFVANWNNQTNVFYQNNGDGTFTKITGRNPVLDADYHVGAAIGDYDNDGNLDLVVSSGDSAATPRRTLLYHNDGGGIFSQASGGTVTNQLGYFGPCVFGDYDNDGFLDLFLANHDALDQTGAKNLLFHNNGDGTFSEVTAGSVVNDVGVAFSALWADYDNDGFMDLIVINNRLANSHNFLYHNNRDGTFTRILTNAVATDSWPVGAEGAAWGDYDNDGLLDLFVTDTAGVRNRLYHNIGNGGLTNVTSGPMLQPPPGGPSVGCGWGDYDNDGYLDLFVCNYGGNNALFHNNGEAPSRKSSPALPSSTRADQRAAGWIMTTTAFLTFSSQEASRARCRTCSTTITVIAMPGWTSNASGRSPIAPPLAPRYACEPPSAETRSGNCERLTLEADGIASPWLRTLDWAMPPTRTRCESNGRRASCKP
jgi:hypothetical protein